MHQHLLVFFIVGVQLATAGAESNGQELQISGTNDKCAKFCFDAFSTQANSMKSCQQGCRLYSVLQFVGKGSPFYGIIGQPNLTALSASCQNGCDEAYKNPVLKSACVDGCQHQSPFNAGPVKVEMDSDSPLFPFVRTLMDNTFGKLNDLQNYMTSRLVKLRSWISTSNLPANKIDTDQSMADDFINFFKALDSKFRSFVEKTQVEIPSKFESENAGIEKSPSPVNPLYAYAKNLAQKYDRDSDYGGDGDQTVLLDRPKIQYDQHGRPIIVVENFKQAEADSARISFSIIHQTLQAKPYGQLLSISNENEKHDGLFTFFFHRSERFNFLSRWILSMALIFTVLSIIYTCLAMLGYGQERQKRQGWKCKLANGDEVYLVPPPAYEEFCNANGYPSKVEMNFVKTSPPAYENIPKENLDYSMIKEV